MKVVKFWAPVFIAILVLFICSAGCGGPTEPETRSVLSIDGYGAMYLGSGVTAEIGGRKYLFVNFNTEGSEPHVIPGILVLDIENPSNPKEVSYLQAPEEILYIASLAISGTTLYVCAADFLWIINVSEPAQLEEISMFADIQPLRMAISGDYAYVNDGNRQISVVDLTDLANIRIVGSLKMISPSGLLLSIRGSVLYAKTSQELHIIDISEPDIPKEINTFTVTFENDSGVGSYYYLRQFTLFDEYAYVILSSESEEAIAVLDISNPATPREISRFEPETSLFGANLFISRDRFYLITMGFDPVSKARPDLLQVYDLSMPTEPVLLDSYYLADYKEYFTTPYDSFISGYGLIDGYLYRFIGNAPNDPVIVTIELPDK